MRSLIFRIALAILVTSPLLAQDKTLSWNRVKIDAQLDADGALRIREEQDILFNGDWNGGERIFSLNSGQRLALQSIARIDESGSEIALTQGDLSAVDQYSQGGSTVRWRSRLPEDPPFASKAITYVLRYSISNVVELVDERIPSFSLSYDFAFPDRAGVIRDFELALDLDPAWSAQPVRMQQKNISPGESAGVNLALRRLDGVIPGRFFIGAPRVGRYAAIGVLLVLAAAAIFRYWKSEQGNARWSPLTTEGVDTGFLQEHVFKHPPEVVGAAWDDVTGSAEVAATLARMTQEKKLKTSVESRGRIFKRNVLVMELLVDRRTLTGHELILVKAFFEGKEKTTDTDSVKKRYQHSKTGFDPGEKIESHVSEAVERLFPKDQRKRPRPSAWPLYLAFFAALGLAITAIVFDGGNSFAIAGLLFVQIVCMVIAGIAGAIQGSAVHGVRARSIATFFVLSLIVLNAGVILTSQNLRLGWLSVLACVALPAAILFVILHHASTPFTAAYIDFRRRLVRSRHFFEQELKKEQPVLKDEWFPYLLAFGLQEHIDRWFKAFPAMAAASGGIVSSSVGSGSSGSASSSSWSGGGGAFGGAGASGTWAVAAAGLASGVPAPSSSSSGGSGGGGGFSSGGGGGGGW